MLQIRNTVILKRSTHLLHLLSNVLGSGLLLAVLRLLGWQQGSQLCQPLSLPLHLIPADNSLKHTLRAAAKVGNYAATGGNTTDAKS